MIGNMSNTGYPQQPPQYPQFPSAFPPPGGYPPPGSGPSLKRRIPWWGWLLIVLGMLGLSSCAGCLGFIWYAGGGPDTKAYAGNEVPASYVQTARDLGLLAADEQIRFFYSDAIRDVRNGMYFVTDRNVVVYRRDAAQSATIVPFTEIADVQLSRGSGWLEDSSVMLSLQDGATVSFPVSTELDRDVAFVRTIEKGAGLDSAGNDDQ
jgi:hypothetical protein